MFKVGDGVKFTREAMKKSIKNALSKEGKPKITEGVVVYIKSAYDRNTELMEEPDYMGGWSFNEPLITLYNDKGEYVQVDGSHLEIDNKVLERMDAAKILSARHFKLGDRIRITEEARNEKTSSGTLLFGEDKIKEGVITEIEEGPSVPLVTYRNEEGKSDYLGATWLEKVPVVTDPKNDEAKADVASI